MSAPLLRVPGGLLLRIFLSCTLESLIPPDDLGNHRQGLLKVMINFMASQEVLRRSGCLVMVGLEMALIFL